jgi:uncharacterized protein YuzE
MAVGTWQNYLQLLPTVKQSPQNLVWMSYDTEADVLYINFKKPSHATDSELADDDVIVRYEDRQIVGFTVLHASKRRKAKPTAHSRKTRNSHVSRTTRNG